MHHGIKTSGPGGRSPGPFSCLLGGLGQADTDAPVGQMHPQAPMTHQVGSPTRAALKPAAAPTHTAQRGPNRSATQPTMGAPMGVPPSAWPS